MRKLGFEDLKNIIRLLEDEDNKVFCLLKDQLISQKENNVVSYLNQELAISENTLVKKRLSNILSEIYYNNIDQYFQKIPVNESGEPDLEHGAFLLCKFGHPEVYTNEYSYQLDSMAKNLKERLAEEKEALKIIKIINNYLFGEEGFQGNKIDYNDPDNSYLNMVMDRRTGIPISLSVIYLLLAKRLKLPFYGVGLPGHFIIKYQDENEEIFVDPYYSGKILTRKDCLSFLLFTGHPCRDEYLEKTKNKDVLKRMIRNLTKIYSERGDLERTNKLKQLTGIISSNF